jgi:hypothetical protein
LTEQQLAAMKLADMQTLLSLALKDRSTQPTDTGAMHLLLLNEIVLLLFSSLLHTHKWEYWKTKMRSSLSQQS